MSTSVTICDVGPRDGLQNEPDIVPVPARAQLVRRLAATGLPRVEAVSFVNPARVPQMAGAEDVVAGIGPVNGTALAGLVLNERGYERLRATRLERVHFAFGATESFNRRNANASVEEGVGAAQAIAARAHEDGRRVTVTISVAFGCPFEGRVDPGHVAALAERVARGGADEVMLADTIGVAMPTQVRRLVERAGIVGPAVGAHLHDTRGTGLANALAALEGGATILDASVGGLGGCPYAPGATGNVATEDVVHLLHGEGVETGVDLHELVAVARWLEQLLRRALPGSVYRLQAL